MSWPRVITICCGCENVYLGRNRWIPLRKLKDEDVYCRHTVCPGCYEKHLKPLKAAPSMPQQAAF
jgi:hypothetical protein